MALNATRTVHDSDDLIGLGWSEASLAASHWFDEAGPWLCEGVAMARALRKWLLSHETGSPADLIVYLGESVAPRSRGQHVMALGVQTVFDEIRDELGKRGTRILDF